jgi:hypothetical protein
MRKERKPSWAVTDTEKPEQAPWKVTTDKKGKQTFLETIPPTLDSIKYLGQYDRSQFTLEIQEGCLVGGNAVAPGDEVVCYSPTASILRCRGKIIAEIKNAF